MNSVAVIMIVDDEEDDRFLLQTALRRAKINNPVQPLADGAEAVAYLEGTGQYADRASFPLPALILTDFAMPGKNAIELLQWMRPRPELAHIPVIVLAGSGYPSEMEQARAAGATFCLSKPSEFRQLVEQLKSICPQYLPSPSPQT